MALASPKDFPFQQTNIYGRRKSLRRLRMKRRRQPVSANGLHRCFTLTAWQGSRAVRPNFGKGRREGGGWSGHARRSRASCEPDPGSPGWEPQCSGSGSPHPCRLCPMPAGSRPPLVAWSPPGRCSVVFNLSGEALPLRARAAAPLACPGWSARPSRAPPAPAIRTLGCWLTPACLEALH